jgi:molecular chaperone Hsp33
VKGGVGHDRAVRAITDDGAFRVIVVSTVDTVRGAISAQRAHGATAKHLGELITGAVLIREAMAPGLRVQAILKPSGHGNLVADSNPDGTSRGLVSFGGPRNVPEEVSVGAGALLQVMRTLPTGMLHQGVVEVPEEGGISGGLMAYMQDSEQVVSMIAVGILIEDDRVFAAGGYLVQLLPEVERGPLMVMTERLSRFSGFEEFLAKDDTSPDRLLDELLYGMPFTRLDESRLSFACQCSHVRVVASLATLPRDDLRELMKDGDVLEIRCDYCGKDYQIPPVSLRSLLTPS